MAVVFIWIAQLELENSLISNTIFSTTLVAHFRIFRNGFHFKEALSSLTSPKKELYLLHWDVHKKDRNASETVAIKTVVASVTLLLRPELQRLVWQ